MIIVGDKVYRNIQEQVEKNKEDIDDLNHRIPAEPHFYTEEETDELLEAKLDTTSVKNLYKYTISYYDEDAEERDTLTFNFYSTNNYSATDLNSVYQILRTTLINNGSVYFESSNGEPIQLIIDCENQRLNYISSGGTVTDYSGYIGSNYYHYNKEDIILKNN